MTAAKFELMALERGILGEDIAAPERITEADIVTVAVSPQGFVFHWNDSGTVSISHVSRLTDIPQPLVYTSMDAWHLYKPKFNPNRVMDIGGYEEPPPAGSSLYQVGLVIKFVWNRVDPAWRVDEGVNVSLAV